MMKTRLVLILVLGLALSACEPTVLTPSAGDIGTALAQTQAADPTEPPASTPPSSDDMATQAVETEAFQPTATEIPPSPTPTSTGPVDGTISAAFLNMRNGPGTLFDVIETYAEGTVIRARARVPENDWLEVVATDDAGETQIGWMAAEYLELESDIRGLPLVSFPETLQVRGRVETVEGTPVPGVNIAVIYRYEAGELRQDVFSNNQGQFTIYLPEELLGTLDIQIVGVVCDSPIMDANCEQTDYFRLEGRAFINIPQDQPLTFRYQEASVRLDGVVLDVFNNPEPDMVVVAVRDDGAEAFVRTDAEGQFSLPLDEGLWEVYTVTFNPRREGERVNVEITDQTPEAIQLSAP